MATTTVVTANELIKFQPDYFKAYLRKTGLTPFMGSGMDKVIKTYSDLNDEGKELNVPIVFPVKNSGVGTGVVGAGAVSVYATDQYDTLVISNSTGVSAPMTNMPPAYIGGITMIRAG